MQWKLKNCPRCHGDTYIEKDEYSWYQQCLQCGYVGELKNFEVSPPQLAPEGEPVPEEEARTIRAG